MTTSKLRPCPFCGEAPILKEFGLRGFVISCPKSDMMSNIVGFVCSDKEGAINFWNSAYCWKELDRLNSENEKPGVQALVEALEFYRDADEDDGGNVAKKALAVYARGFKGGI